MSSLKLAPTTLIQHKDFARQQKGFLTTKATN